MRPESLTLTLIITYQYTEFLHVKIKRLCDRIHQNLDRFDQTNKNQLNSPDWIIQEKIVTVKLPINPPSLTPRQSSIHKEKQRNLNTNTLIMFEKKCFHVLMLRQQKQQIIRQIKQIYPLKHTKHVYSEEEADNKRRRERVC